MPEQPEEIAAEFERLSRLAHGDSKGWKFNREEIHDRGTADLYSAADLQSAPDPTDQ